MNWQTMTTKNVVHLLHLPPPPPSLSPSLLQTMKDDGLNMVETYVFWNLHEPTQLRGSLKYNFEGYANLTLFLEKAASAGLFVNLRIGPYVCAEWNWGRTPSLLLLCCLIFSVFSFPPYLCHVCPFTFCSNCIPLSPHNPILLLLFFLPPLPPPQEGFQCG